MTLFGVATALISAFILGLIISFTYKKTHVKGQYSQNFSLTLVMIPCVIAIIIMMVGSNIARAFGLTGAFSIIRFRSNATDPKDISYVLFTMAAGLACGSGSYGYAAFFTILLCIIMFILSKVNFGAKDSTYKLLKIIIPEDLDYHGAFDEVFEKYTVNHDLKKVKTTDLGTLYELVYNVTIKNDMNEKSFMDELRCRNGNLNIILAMNAEPGDN
nr:DUF4956 domain-containing protein [Ruminiclostridium sufflavum]